MFWVSLGGFSNAGNCVFLWLGMTRSFLIFTIEIIVLGL